MGKLVKFIARGFVLFIFIFPAVLGVSSYVLVTSYQDSLKNLQKLSKDRGKELAVTLAALTSENRQDEDLVKVSAAMKAAVSSLSFQAAGFEVTSIALLDQVGRVQASHDVARVAKEAEQIFKGGEYDSVLSLPKGKVLFRTLPDQETSELEQGIFSILSEKLEELPDPLNSWGQGLANEISELEAVQRYHLGMAVYPVVRDKSEDDSDASYSLHMLIRVNVAGNLADDFKESLIKSILVDFLMAMGITFLLSLIFLIPIFSNRPKVKQTPATSTPPKHPVSPPPPPFVTGVQMEQAPLISKSENLEPEPAPIPSPEMPPMMATVPPGVEIYEAKTEKIGVTPAAAAVVGAAVATGVAVKGKAKAKGKGKKEVVIEPRILDAIPLD